MLFLQTLSFAQLSQFPGDVGLPLPPQSPCINSGFESGNFNNWETFTGLRPVTGGVDLSTLTQNYNASLHSIVNSNFNDPIGGFPRLNCGNKSAKIGNIQGGSDVSMIKYTFTVTPANVNFSFRYAMVLQDPNHTIAQQPFFQYLLLTGDRSYYTNANQIIASKKFVSASSNPFFTPVNNGLVYKDWSTECISLSAYMGQEVSVLFLIADCSLGGHGTYAYVDCLCENNDAIASMTLNGNDFCKEDPIIMDATASINEDSYFISIAESDQNWFVIPGTEVSQWFIAQQTSIIDITALANQWGYEFKCNRYYRIKLAVSNNCVYWNETVKLIYIRCPEDVGLGQDITLCCNSLFPITIEDENYNDHPSYTYNWISNPPRLAPNPPTVPAFTFTPHQSATYNVTVTDDYGCTLTDDINVIIEQDFEVTLSYEELGCCSKLLVPSVSFINCEGIYEEDPAWQLTKHQQLYYQWSDGATGYEHQVSPNQNTTYTLTVSNLCYSHTVTIEIEGCPQFSGEFPRLNYPPSMESTSNSINEWLVISNMNVPVGTPNAYHATGYTLEIIDRWGGIHKVAEQLDYCEGFNNSDIYWNGRINGSSVQDGTYTFMLTLYNNTYPHIPGPYVPLSNNLTPNGGKKMLDWYAYICTSYSWNWWCFCNLCNSGGWNNHTQWYGKILVSN